MQVSSVDHIRDRIRNSRVHEVDFILHTRTSRSERSRASILTVADTPALLEVGVARPATAIALEPGGPVLVAAGSFVGTSIEAVVSPAGDGEATLRITPYFSQRGGGGAVAVTEMATTVRVPLGRPVVIGSTNVEQDSVARTILSRRNESGREEAVLILTVTGG